MTKSVKVVEKEYQRQTFCKESKLSVFCPECRAEILDVEKLHISLSHKRIVKCWNCESSLAVSHLEYYYNVKVVKKCDNPPDHNKECNWVRKCSDKRKQIIEIWQEVCPFKHTVHHRVRANPLSKYVQLQLPGM